jgi:O-antigen/teichoic acid export membrane protein
MVTPMTLSVSWAFAGNAVYTFCQWLVFALMLRSLPLADVGVFAYWIAVTGPVFVLANVRLRNLVATGVSSPNGFADYLAARLLTVAAAVCVSLALGAVLAKDAWAFTILALVVAAKAFDAVADICHGLFQRELDMRSAAIGLTMNGVLSVALVGVSLAASPSLRAAVAAYAAASALAVAGWDLRRTGKHLGAAERSIVRREVLPAAGSLIWRATPLGLSSGIASLQIHLPRYAIGAYLGPASLAVFTALAYIPALGNLIANATAQAALPLLARDLRTSNDLYRRHLRILVGSGVALGVLTVIATALLGRSIVTLIYGAGIAQQHSLLTWLMVAAALTYAFLPLGTATAARTRFAAQALISTASILVVAVFIVPLVSRYGLLGGAYALCAAALVEGGAYVALTLHDSRSDARLGGIAVGAMAEAGGR